MFSVPIIRYFGLVLFYNVCLRKCGGGEEVCLWRQGTAVCEDQLTAPNHCVTLLSAFNAVSDVDIVVHSNTVENKPNKYRNLPSMCSSRVVYKNTRKLIVNNINLSPNIVALVPPCKVNYQTKVWNKSRMLRAPDELKVFQTYVHFLFLNLHNFAVVLKQTHQRLQFTRGRLYDEVDGQLDQFTLHFAIWIVLRLSAR